MSFNKRAKILISPREVEKLLSLPEGVGVIGLKTQFDPLGFVVLVTSDEFDECIPEAESPIVNYRDLDTLVEKQKDQVAKEWSYFTK